MGMGNYLIEGVSGTGKTAVCTELQRRGYHAIHGDRELAYQGDPETGTPTDGLTHEHSATFISEHHIWHVDKRPFHNPKRCRKSIAGKPIPLRLARL